VRRLFRIVALIETCSWLLLIAAMVLKYGAGQPVGVDVMGPIHGLAFIAYFALVVLLRDAEGLPGRTALQLLFAALLPFGGVLAERRLLGSAPAAL
jgi:integral membrane protein